MQGSKFVRGWLALALAVATFASVPAAAQNTGSVQGTVVDAQTGRPLQGAQVLLEGTTRSVVTGADGRYTLENVTAGTITIRVRIIGYTGMGQTLRVTPGGTPTTADFQLTRSAISLDDIVVTGTGREVERRKLAAPVNVINAAEIENTAVTDVAQLLQGKVAGATVNATSAQPGTTGLINFRGVSSVFGSQTPVIYIDGVRVDNSDATSSGTGGEESSALADLLTNDIERIEITKGGAASTLYGADAASGVIQIFTKKGTPGAPRVTARVEQGFDDPELKYMFDTGFIYPDEIENNGADPDFLKNNYFQTGHFQNYYLDVSGGQEDFTYTASGRIQQADGVQLKNDSEIYTVRGAIQADISSKTSVNFTANYTRSEFRRLFNGSAIADPLTSFEVGDVFFFTGEDNFDDALRVFTLPDINEEVNRFRFSSGLNFRGSDLFSGRATMGVDYRTNQQREFSPIGAVIVNGGAGQLQRTTRDFSSITLDLAGTISWPRGDVFQSDFTFGAQGFRDDVSFASFTAQTFALPGAPDLDEGATLTGGETNTEVFNGGFYFQEEISLWDKLFINGGIRLDANSTFGDEVSVEAFPKVGASYLVSEESFFQDVLGSFLNTLKLRAAFGQTGKFPSPFSRDRSFSATQFRGESAARFSNPGNLDLAPEVKSTIEVGFEAALLDNRVGINFTYFDETTKDALFRVPEPPLTGLGTQLRNVGEISNTGIEVDGNFQVLDADNVRWNLGLTYAFVDNEVVSLGGAPAFNITGQQRVEEEHPVGAWRVFTPIDTNGDGLNDSSELQFTGSQPTPTRSGSITTSVTLFNNLTISGSGDWATGHEVMDFGSVWATFNGIFRRELLEFDDVNGNGERDVNETTGEFTEPGFDFPRRYDTAGNLIGTYSQNQARTAFILDGDWFKWRELSVRYAVPRSIFGSLGLDRATVYGSIRNVAIYSRNPLIDPELNGLSAGGNLQLGGRSSVTLSPARNFRFGVEASF